MATLYSYRPAPCRDERANAGRSVQTRDRSPSGFAPRDLERGSESAEIKPSTVSGAVIYFFVLCTSRFGDELESSRILIALVPRFAVKWRRTIRISGQINLDSERKAQVYTVISTPHFIPSIALILYTYALYGSDREHEGKMQIHATGSVN
jgi:hypothetical protein